MTEVMRDMIAQLMGAQRAMEEGRDLPPYNHHSVCRAYLLGCCPAEILADTRLETLVSCRKLHEPAHKADFEVAQKKKDHYFDVEVFDYLADTIRIVDGEIEKIKSKLDRESKDAGENAEILKLKRIADLEEQIRKLVNEVEDLGNSGQVEESLQSAKRIEELENKKNELKTDTRSMVANTTQRLRVCDDCGAQLNIMDHETRLADHFGGKMHLGMVEIRERYNEMKDNIEERRKERAEKGDGDRDSRRSPDRRDRDRDRRDRDRDRDRERDRKRSRSRDRDRRRRSRSRSRDRRDRNPRDDRGDRDRRRR